MEQCYHKEPNGKAGFSEDINKKIQSDKESSENNSTYKSFFGVDWQVPVLDSVHFREDHENDTPCQRGFLSRDREGTLRTWPWTAHPFIAAQTGLINSENDTLIQQLHSKCVSICMEADRNPSRQRALNGMTKNYLPYLKSRDLLVTEPSTPADHVLTDHSIKTIISAMWQALITPISTMISGKMRRNFSSLVTIMGLTLTWLLLSSVSQTIRNSLPVHPIRNLPLMTLLVSPQTPTKRGSSLNVLQLYFLPQIREQGFSLCHLHPYLDTSSLSFPTTCYLLIRCCWYCIR
ncbi:hypothetical protein IV203_037458 [Nitzschia inconspicua]|uniref:Uncharacterized protein n=1 Tax=Nitzschia inconspicua TaxID=303405 RepID=A0A9K3PYK7_9STRA|nr:hypothetical protein IV203_037458 [Nitzschia inconspicua]